MSISNESDVCTCSVVYMRAGIGNDRLVVCFSKLYTLTYCISYIFHVHDRIVVSFSNISAYFARNAESLITQESLRKSCSCRRFRLNPFTPRRPSASVFRHDRVLLFGLSGVMISIKSIDRHIGHESSVEDITNISIESAIRHGQRHVCPFNDRGRGGRFSSGLCRYA